MTDGASSASQGPQALAATPREAVNPQAEEPPAAVEQEFFEVSDAEFERLMQAGHLHEAGEDTYAMYDGDTQVVSEEEFERLMQAGRLQEEAGDEEEEDAYGAMEEAAAAFAPAAAAGTSAAHGGWANRSLQPSPAPSHGSSSAQYAAAAMGHPYTFATPQGLGFNGAPAEYSPTSYAMSPGPGGYQGSSGYATSSAAAAAYGQQGYGYGYANEYSDGRGHGAGSGYGASVVGGPAAVDAQQATSDDEGAWEEIASQEAVLSEDLKAQAPVISSAASTRSSLKATSSDFQRHVPKLASHPAGRQQRGGGQQQLMAQSGANLLFFPGELGLINPMLNQAPKARRGVPRRDHSPGRCSPNQFENVEAEGEDPRDDQHGRHVEYERRESPSGYDDSQAYLGSRGQAAAGSPLQSARLLREISRSPSCEAKVTVRPPAKPSAAKPLSKPPVRMRSSSCRQVRPQDRRTAGKLGQTVSKGVDKSVGARGCLVFDGSSCVLGMQPFVGI